MSTVGRYWKIIFALLLLIAAVIVYFAVYRPAHTEYETQLQTLDASIRIQELSSGQVQQQDGILELLPEKQAEIAESRRELYNHFPVAMREEDQILYILDLEQIFGTEIDFDFGRTETISLLSDGTVLQALKLKINYVTTYEGFKDMLDYLSKDSRITSVRHADMQYNAETDTLSGTVTIQRYLLVPPGAEYQEPDIETPGEIGKDTIFG